MISNAIISDDQIYRYWLTRVWDDSKFCLPIVGLNPSTADASNDDPTIRRDIGFARREGAGGIIKVNLHAFRSTKPENLVNARDPVGPENHGYLGRAIHYAASNGIPIVCAWGASGGWSLQGPAFVARAQAAGAALICLGITADGNPRHPLYVKADAPWQVYPPV